ncbi:hypothetical protein B0H13DRAFT_1850512 [Mycena leptocephala]|nr:hypothetical protein B0H13DRAFT_1850512 [Mycena leptocephala]
MCRAKTNDGELCDCEQYDQPPDPSAPSRCMECGHGKSKHGLGQLQPVEAKKNTVLDIFAAQAERHIKDLLPATARVTDFGTARTDALRNYRVAPQVSSQKKREKDGLALRTMSYGALRKLRLLLIENTRRSTECTKYFAEIFPKAFEHAMMHTQNPEGGIWMIAAKEYKALRLVPKVKPTGADIINFKQKDVPLYIVLVKPIPDEVYASCSDYNPAKDPDGDDEGIVSMPERYEMRLHPTPSIRKRQALAASESDSELDDVMVKKRKLNSGKPYTNQIGSSSRRSEPSPSSKAIPLRLYSDSRVPTSKISPSASNGQQQSSKCSCQRVSPPPTVVISKLVRPPWDEDSLFMSPSTYVNPWNPGYKPPSC